MNTVRRNVCGLLFVPLVFAFATTQIVSAYSRSNYGLDKSEHVQQKETDEARTSRLERLIDKGEYDEPWRYAVSRIRSNGLRQCFGATLVLGYLTKREALFRIPSLALVEERLLQGEKLDDMADILLQTYAMISGLKLASPEGLKGEELGIEVEQRHHLSTEAVEFCSQQLSKASISSQRAAAPIIVSAAQIGGPSRQWALLTSRKQMESARSEKTGFWRVLYEAVSRKRIE